MNVSMWGDWLPQLLDGLKTSLLVTGLSLIFGLPLGLLFAFGMIGANRYVRWLTLVVVELGRGVPLLVLLYLVYFGFPSTGLVFGAFAAAVLAISFNTGAYTSEIFRAGLLSVPSGHLEASRSLGLTGLDEARYVVLPQAVRNVVPPLMSYGIIVFQATSLGYAISLPEMLNRAYEIGSVTFQYMSVLLLAGVIYAVISIVVSRLVDRVHARMN
jgi:polar amino acid transport system permease protein